MTKTDIVFEYWKKWDKMDSLYRDDYIKDTICKGLFKEWIEDSKMIEIAGKDRAKKMFASVLNSYFEDLSEYLWCKNARNRARFAKYLNGLESKGKILKGTEKKFWKLMW